jgi:hypothetical protein
MSQNPESTSQQLGGRSEAKQDREENGQATEHEER